MALITATFFGLSLENQAESLNISCLRDFCRIQVVKLKRSHVWFGKTIHEFIVGYVHGFFIAFFYGI